MRKNKRGIITKFFILASDIPEQLKMVSKMTALILTYKLVIIYINHGTQSGNNFYEGIEDVGKSKGVYAHKILYLGLLRVSNCFDIVQ